MTWQRWQQVYLLPIMIALLSIATIERQVHLSTQAQISGIENNLSARLDTASAKIERDLNSAISLSNGLNSYIKSQGGRLDNEVMQNWLAGMFIETEQLINIGVAPGNRIELIHPIAGNEAALGIYYPDLANQWPAIKAIIDSGTPKLVGPINLVQGGLGFIYRSPIYIDGDYWGITSIVMDADLILAHLDQVSASVQLTDDQQQLLFGKPELPTLYVSAHRKLAVPGVDWTLSAFASTQHVRSNQIRLASYPLALLFAVAVLLLASARYRSALRTQQLARENELVQREFVAIVSHELKTPITAIQGSLALLDHQLAKNLDTQGANLLNIARRNTAHLGLLINNLLDLDRMSKGTLTLSSSNIDLYPLATFVMNFMQNEASSKNITLNLDRSETSALAYGDPDRVQQIIHQLLSNAIKFSPENSHINITLTSTDEQAIISVQDEGQGIDAGTQAILFERFRQGHTGASRKAEGVGIGLALVYELATLMGGNVSFDTSEQGTTFTITLPNLG
ncbi:sensor histidine kinase [Salinibius halmophilus]|uniref:sensor histidine kinase n=1 Tax=Salinibius halmophilus TaxID=1853216 RepID=UPI000E67330A|nr:ATP-binding protein [Salinibius halmophilus]